MKPQIKCLMRPYPYSSFRMFLMILWGAFLFSGCAQLIPNPGHPPTRYTLTYLTEAPQPEPKHAKKPPVAIHVAVPTVYSTLDTQRIAFAPAPQTIDYIADAEWGDRLPTLLQESLVISLQNRLPRLSVQRTPQSMAPHYVLQVDVRKFHIQQTDATVAVLEYFVRMIRTADRTIVYQQTIHDAQPLQVFDRDHMAEALDTLNQRALERIVHIMHDHARVIQ